jgi:hypothetical protein
MKVIQEQESDNLIVTRTKELNYQITNNKGDILIVDLYEALEAMSFSPDYWVKMEM